MIVVRNLFHIQPDQMQKAKKLALEGHAILQGLGYPRQRAMTDLTGEYYTLILESEFNSVADYESTMKKVQANPKWKKFYPKLRKLMNGGRRDLFSVVE